MNSGLSSGIDGTSAGTKAGGGFTSGFGSVVKGIATAAVVQSAAQSVGALFASAFNEYATYEQLVGGVETLFKGSADVVQQYAADAYQTAGMSANEYMDTVTSFSASLISGLGGDTAQAAEVANVAITDMADNANKMGTDMESIQNAYQGFAKQNYTMLDNLKLGYGGTQSEMIRLINDSGVLEDEITSLDGVSFDTMIAAIHKVQQNMGITGTTAAEAASTVEGSMNSMKSAWTNMLTSLGTGNTATVQTAVQNLVNTAYNFIVNNALPLIGTIATSIGTLIVENAPNIMASISSLLQQAVTWLTENRAVIGETVGNFLTDAVTMIVENAPGILAAIGSLLVEVISTIAANLPEVITKIGECIANAASSVADGAGQMLTAAGDFIQGLIDGIIAGKDAVINKIKEICNGALDAVKNFFGIASPSKVMRSMGGYIAEGMALGIGDGAGSITSAWNKATSGIVDRSVAIGVSGTASRGVGSSSKMGVYLDGSKLVGYLLPDIDTGLGRLQTAAGR